MSRPFYRSRLFWLGVPGFLFLIWAWLVGEVSAGWAGTNAAADLLVFAGVGGGVMGVGFEDGLTPLSESIRWGIPGYEYGFHWRAGTASDPTPWVWPPIQVQRESRDEGGRASFQLEVALWMLVAGYAGAWAAIYHKWQRRKARLLKLQSVPSP